MSKQIIAEMVKDWVVGYERQSIPRVMYSTHPRFVEGTRLDWGFVQVALQDGYQLTIWPLEGAWKEIARGE